MGLYRFMLAPKLLISSVSVFPGDDDNSLVLNLEGFRRIVNVL